MNKIIFIIVFILPIAFCDNRGVELTVYNANDERIDSLQIEAGKRKYLIENLEPKRIKSIQVLIIGDVSLVVKAYDYSSIIVKERFMSHKPKGKIHIGINKDKLEFVSSGN